MRAPLLLLGGIVVLSVAVARALSCVCSPLECDVLTEEDCPGGLTWDPCRCCKVCARVEGEPCGGLFGFSGSCAVGLQCVIKNLLHHAREVDEGVCAKIPGRWRRHCPHGPIMSGSGCNLIGEGTSSSEGGDSPATGKCVCGPSVPWCPGEPRPYVYMTRHECKLNLAAKIAYDDLYNSEDNSNADVDGLSTSTVLRNESGTTWPNQDIDKDVVRATECPVDSVANEDGSCKCRPTCPPSNECRPGQRQVQVRSGNPEMPGHCCPRYECISTGSHAGDCPEDSVLTDDGHCKCVPTCPTPTCTSGRRPVEVRRGVLERPGSCCPLYDCVPPESVSWADREDASVPGNYCINEGVSRKLGERWQPTPCHNCICKEQGQVSCQMPMCKTCEKPIPPGPGECCPQCPPIANTTNLEPDKPCRDSLIDCDLKCEEYVSDENSCPICECVKRKKHVNEEGEDEEEDGTICQELSHCDLNCELVKDEGGCPVCICQETARPSGELSNDTEQLAGKKVCPEVKCDLHCERGLVMDENDCTFCECKPAHAGCPPIVGCKKKCVFGYKTNKRGCPICRCRASCTDYLNQTHPEGATWHPNTCTTCTCEAGGRLNCKETFCSIPCSNPLPPKSGTCCPYCPVSVPGWGTVPITLIVVLTLLCLLLIVHIVRNRFRGRLSPSDATYASYPPQYYKCVPAYDTPVHRNEKIVPL